MSEILQRRILEKQLALHEGRRLTPYMDTVGKITIGVGRNLSDNGISPSECDLLLSHDIDDVIRDLVTFAWFADLDPVRQRVVADMRFNLGPNRLRQFQRTLRRIEAGDYTGAASSMRESLWARQVKSRADRLIQMMRTGEDPPELQV